VMQVQFVGHDSVSYWRQLVRCLVGKAPDIYPAFFAPHTGMNGHDFRMSVCASVEPTRRSIFLFQLENYWTDSDEL
jgi:hypothetical protein